MQTSKFMATLLAAALGTANVAWAQGDPRNTVQHADPNIRQPHEPGYRGGARHDNRGNDHRADARYDRRGPGAGPNHDFYRGGRLPPQYRSHQYVVNDWRGHHLSPPPRGYHWVQTGGDYVLAAIATGVITSIILNAAANR